MRFAVFILLALVAASLACLRVLHLQMCKDMATTHRIYPAAEQVVPKRRVFLQPTPELLNDTLLFTPSKPHRLPVLASPGCTPRPDPPGMLELLAQNPYEDTPVAGELHVVLVIFSGRGDRMRVLLAYVDALRHAGLIQQVHLWDSGGESDSEWLRRVSSRSGFKLFRMLRSWNSVYEFYASYQVPGLHKSQVVIVKCDDDIVFMDADHFESFVNYTARRQDLLLVHANTVNNGVTAYYQFQRMPLNDTDIAPFLRDYPPNGMEGPLWNNMNSTSYEVHKLFLKQPSAFQWDEPAAGGCVDFRPPGSCVQSRFSINFFAARLAVWPLLHMLVEDGGGGDDEAAITTKASGLGHRQCFFAPFNVVHLAFRAQPANLQMLPLYLRLAKEKGLSLPEHPAPWCEDGYQHGDHDSDSLEFMIGISPSECMNRCISNGDCSGVVHVRRGCAGYSDECHLKSKVLPLTQVANPCYCVRLKTAAVQF